ncbi:MAG: ribonuclease D [Proteobacteria bacterium]|jgi:ribonuclease D|nr:ribonuclease D [Pseudomonadota bacterium]MDA1299183.1 ribonuclease D [Pseudomonadota bacterium]
MDYHYIDQPDALREAVIGCETAKVLAVDTEFARFNTYYPIVGLIQIYNGDQCFLIDPLSIEDLSPLAGLMTAPKIIKVFHACSEDLEVFQQCLGVMPSPLFDTQIAAALLGVRFSMSYQNLVSHYLGIDVPKEETRSDWLQRPLTESQLDYAALDVIYLYQVYGLQREALEKAQRQPWVDEECERMSVDVPTMIDPDLAYKKIKGTNRLNPQQLNVLRAVAAWREQQARKRDMPRNRILDNKALLAIARRKLTSRQELEAQAGLSFRQARRIGDELIEIASTARATPEDQYPDSEEVRGPIDSQQLKALRRHADELAEALQVAPELLVKRRHLEELLAPDGELSEELLGWRRGAVVRALQQLVSTLRVSS